jgi:hypothetical protein
MRRSRVPSNEPGSRFFAAQFSAGCINSMSGFDFRQAKLLRNTERPRFRAERFFAVNYFSRQVVGPCPNFHFSTHIDQVVSLATRKRIGRLVNQGHFAGPNQPDPKSRPFIDVNCPHPCDRRIGPGGRKRRPTRPDQIGALARPTSRIATED